MLDPMRDKKTKARTGAEKGRHLWPRLVQKFVEYKPSYELGWKSIGDGLKKQNPYTLSPRLNGGIFGASVLYTAVR